MTSHREPQRKSTGTGANRRGVMEEAQRSPTFSCGSWQKRWWPMARTEKQKMLACCAQQGKPARWGRRAFVSTSFVACHMWGGRVWLTPGTHLNCSLLHLCFLAWKSKSPAHGPGPGVKHSQRALLGLPGSTTATRRKAGHDLAELQILLPLSQSSRMC